MRSRVPSFIVDDPDFGMRSRKCDTTEVTSQEQGSSRCVPVKCIAPEAGPMHDDGYDRAQDTKPTAPNRYAEGDQTDREVRTPERLTDQFHRVQEIDIVMEEIQKQWESKCADNDLEKIYFTNPNILCRGHAF